MGWVQGTGMLQLCEGSGFDTTSVMCAVVLPITLHALNSVTFKSGKVLEFVPCLIILKYSSTFTCVGFYIVVVLCCVCIVTGIMIGLS